MQTSGAQGGCNYAVPNQQQHGGETAFLRISTATYHGKAYFGKTSLFVRYCIKVPVSLTTTTSLANTRFSVINVILNIGTEPQISQVRHPLGKLTVVAKLTVT